MLIYPAIDLIGGRCVRLAQGRFEAVTVYSGDPAAALAAFAEAGAAWTHVVDLDGARAGRPQQHGLIAELARAARQRLQVAGGFRTAGQVAALLDAGAARVVIGGLALEDPTAAAALVAAFGADRIALAFDIRTRDGTPEVAASAWQAGSGITLWKAIDRVPGARHILVTDIDRDGMLTGPNLSLIAELVDRHPTLAVQASGGISSLADIGAVARSGAAGAIIGKALWERRLCLPEAIHAGL